MKDHGKRPAHSDHFQTMFTGEVKAAIGGIVETFPPLPKCLNTNLTEMMPYVMDSMTHDKPIVMKNKTWMCPGDSVQSMRSVAVPCYINTTNTIVTLSKNVCQNETSTAVTDLEDKCVNNRNGVANGTEQISGPLVRAVEMRRWIKWIKDFRFL